MKRIICFLLYLCFISLNNIRCVNSSILELEPSIIGISYSESKILKTDGYVIIKGSNLPRTSSDGVNSPLIKITQNGDDSQFYILKDSIFIPLSDQTEADSISLSIYYNNNLLKEFTFEYDLPRVGIVYCNYVYSGQNVGNYMLDVYGFNFNPQFNVSLYDYNQGSDSGYCQVADYAIYFNFYVLSCLLPPSTAEQIIDHSLFNLTLIFGDNVHTFPVRVFDNSETEQLTYNNCNGKKNYSFYILILLNFFILFM
ncbi:hypothetical protein DICPUDRAFT_76548 [Dictyostelium purpureum]|uniref:IPT/TIG domain-containing protein n=1 Tax=Dictyostelium purpureum TaxID=5786 RepID=F0ZDY2_DICPU|nr:uncharacterized protein DICPUDRAFT_76548 [Dictyostelium purpureum]EGC37863.1 hypothetical protein DICPUDRAFT_76548 [Dictyostelium purpureum]|eukprot:XP_003285613.1 hypothetical protein DICPUDRAFT_76548 [Dictyostelium purpureum]